MNKIKIFYTDSSEEIKNSIERYFLFVKGIDLNESCFLYLPHFNKEEYFDKIYPVAFDGYDLYFIFDDYLHRFKDSNNLSESGIIFSIIMDLLISQNDGCNYDINVIKICNKSEIETYSQFNSIKTEFNFNSEKEILDFVKIVGIKKYEDKDLMGEIAHPHEKGPKREGVKELINFLQISEKNQSVNSPTKNAELSSKVIITESLNNIIKNSVFIFLIDDVLGDYNKTFLPFYTLLKYKCGRLLIMRGISDPLALPDALKFFPCDIVLVDISFEKLEDWQKDLRYRFYFTEEKFKAGIKLYKQLCTFRYASIFTKKKTLPKIKIFTSYKWEEEICKNTFQKEEKCTSTKEIESILSELNLSKKEVTEIKKNLKDTWIHKRALEKIYELAKGYQLTDSYFKKESEDFLKKTIYLKRYKKDNKLEKECWIWKLIATGSSGGERDLVNGNWMYFSEKHRKLGNKSIGEILNDKDTVEIKKNGKTIKIYTGLKELEKDLGEEPILDIEEIKKGESDG